jgi:hypothetical protein
LAVDRLRKEGLGSNDIALGAEPEIDCLSRSINGTVKIGPFFHESLRLVDTP